MKKICVMLMVCCIALLTVQPAASLIYSLAAQDKAAAKGCCKAPEQEQHDEDCCGNGSCNPFTTCACCASYLITGSIRLKPRPAVFVEKDPPLLQPERVSGRSPSDCWRPPEIA